MELKERNVIKWDEMSNGNSGMQVYKRQELTKISLRGIISKNFLEHKLKTDKNI